MKQFEIEVIAPSKQVYKGNIVSVTVPGTNGNFQVLYNHAPLLSSFEIGKVKIKEEEGSEETVYATGGGTVEVLGNKVLLLAESLERYDEIDVKRAEAAAERAKERLAKKDESIDVARAEAALHRAINRLKIAQMK
ncbi:MAG: F0F1 ATP synthase subunit epsilon [Chlorobi bacterium]|nr:F0F1 ATP synthase subunit epsilon [Chlorobiota bacterium]